MSQPTFYFPLNIQIAPYTVRIMIKYKNMMLYMLVNNYQLIDFLVRRKVQSFFYESINVKKVLPFITKFMYYF